MLMWNHCLLYCYKFDIERNLLRNALQRQLYFKSVLLNRDKNCSLEQNEHIFLSVQQYILQTGRLS